MGQLNFSPSGDLSLLCTEHSLETPKSQRTVRSGMRCALAGQVSPVVCPGWGTASPTACPRRKKRSHLPPLLLLSLLHLVRSITRGFNLAKDSFFSVLHRLVHWPGWWEKPRRLRGRQRRTRETRVSTARICNISFALGVVEGLISRGRSNYCSLLLEPELVSIRFAALGAVESFGQVSGGARLTHSK